MMNPLKNRTLGPVRDRASVAPSGIIVPEGGTAAAFPILAAGLYAAGFNAMVRA